MSVRFEILAVGKAKKTDFAPMIELYRKRIGTSAKITITEITTSDSSLENKELETAIEARQGFVFALDSRGKTMSSPDFSQLLSDLKTRGENNFIFIIGGSEGLSDNVKKYADKTLSFGAQTWPHMLARVMLLEQIYRSIQIENGHPYHK